jgi:RNA recognition motif-containing protein
MILTTRSFVALCLLAVSSSAFLVVPQSPRCLNRIVSASSSVLSSEADATNTAPPTTEDIESISTKVEDVVEGDDSATPGRKVERERNTVFVGNLPFGMFANTLAINLYRLFSLNCLSIPRCYEPGNKGDV